MFDFWMHLKAAETEEEANDPVLHQWSQGGAPPRPIYDEESRELDPVALVEGFVEAGDIGGLLRMLDYHHPAVVVAVIDGFTALGPQVVPYLVQASHAQLTALTVRLRIATALSEMAHDGHLQALRGLASLLAHPTEAVRRRALFLLVQHGAASLPALVPLLRGGSLAATAAVVEIGEPRGFHMLMQLAHRLPLEVPPERSPGLSRDDSRTGLEPMVGRYDAAHLRRLIGHQAASMEERRMAIFRLAERERAKAADTLRDILLSDAPDALRSAAALALGYIGDVSSVPALKQADDQETAALALDLVYGDIAFNTLLLALLHSDAATRRAAAYALGIAGDERARPHLMPLLHDGDPSVKRAAMVALYRIEGVHH